jgi:uncharacterized protein
VGVQLTDSFTIAAPVDKVWDYFKDPQRVAKCVPGANLDQVISPTHFKGGVKIKMGPVSLEFKGEVKIVDRNDGAKRIVLKASGAEAKGKGQAEMTATAQVSGSQTSTNVTITQDITMSGAVAQYGRGMMGDVTKVLLGQVGKCIQGDLQGKGAAAASSLGGMGLMAASTKVGIKRIFGGKK